MRTLILLGTLLAAPCVMAATDAEIVNAVKQRAESGFFPKDVKVVSLKEVISSLTTETQCTPDLETYAARLK